MLRNALILSAAILAACAPQAETPVPDATDAADMAQPVATKVFSSGTIYTGVGSQTVDAVAVDADGRIVWTGTADSVDAQVDIENAEFVSLNNGFMYPGFTDSHAHLLGIGQRELSLDLTGTASIEELVTRIAAEAESLGEEAIIVGRGWIETGWPEGRMPSAADLDAVVGDRIVILQRSDGHALVASSAALEAAGIDAATPDPDGGKIERDADGNATGILIDNAMTPLWGLVAQPSDEDIRRAYVEGAGVYAARGWTGLHNMSVPADHAGIMAELDGDGGLPIRIYNAFDEDGFAIAEARSFETDTITNRAVKLYMDGALGSRGALLIEPYSDRPDTSGLALLEPDGLSALMQKADEQGVQLAIHAIGDLANRRILDVYEELGLGADKRWRIEHTQILHPDDIARVPGLGLIASMQPSHAIGDLKFAPARLGMDRLDGAYAWQDLLDAGAVIAGGSDAPVEVGSPLIEFYAAVAREDLDGNSGEGWHPEQALSREDALALFTSSAAYAAFMEDDLGTIEIGKLADFTVFDADLMSVPEDEILELNAVMTVVQGEIVWSATD
ncbi:amidohydrolase [Henriciella marina]|uniref:amidohydrolase n=1 Tax=Henriciella marina TaxID=453851 RepID=UPI0003A89FEA|nr:amidohydrolase [Henriciella marina]